jgi:hypothetical protein
MRRLGLVLFALFGIAWLTFIAAPLAQASAAGCAGGQTGVTLHVVHYPSSGNTSTFRYTLYDQGATLWMQPGYVPDRAWFENAGHIWQATLLYEGLVDSGPWTTQTDTPFTAIRLCVEPTDTSDGQQATSGDVVSNNTVTINVDNTSQQAAATGLMSVGDPNLAARMVSDRPSWERGPADVWQFLVLTRSILWPLATVAGWAAFCSLLLTRSRRT